jgi:hypothetical protein
MNSKQTALPRHHTGAGVTYKLQMSPDQIMRRLYQPLERLKDPTCPCYQGRPPKTISRPGNLHGINANWDRG